MFAGREYSPVFHQSWKKIPEGDMICASANVFMKKDSDATLVVSIESKGEAIQWQGMKLNRMLDSNNKWQTVYLNFPFPRVSDDHAEVKMYVWNPSGSDFYLDDMTFRVLEKRHTQL
jgi:hypothetical protein